MLKINEIKKNYESFDDLKIQRIAVDESKGLRDEIIPILLDEIEKRELGTELILWVNAERRKPSTFEWQELISKVRNCLCESCNHNRKLKGYKFKTVTGFVLMEVVSNFELIVCETCGNKKRRASTFQTLFFGWLSVRGIIAYPFVITDKIKSYLFEEEQSKKIIKKFILNNIGEITLGEDSQVVIQKLIKEFYYVKPNL